MGGDYYDFLELPDGRLGIAIGDVSGKGVGAALMMASLEASLRALASVVDDPAELMERVNSLVYAGVLGEPLRHAVLRAVRSGKPPLVLRQRGS